MAYLKINKNTRAQPIYASNSITSAAEVSALVNSIRISLGPANMNNIMIYVLSGVSGDAAGNLTGDKIFFLENLTKELQTVKTVNVDQSTPATTWLSCFSKTNVIIILAWCNSCKWSGLSTFNTY
jgi:hypothetical protein